MAKLRGEKRAELPAKSTTPASSTPNPYQFKKGTVYNPGGRPKGSRNRFCTQFMDDFYQAWREGGIGLIRTMYRDQPSAILRAAVAILPSKVEVDAEATIYVLSDKPISGDEWAAKYADPTPVTIDVEPIDGKVH